MGKLAQILSPNCRLVFTTAQALADRRSEPLTTAHIIIALFNVDRTIAFDMLHDLTDQAPSLAKRVARSTNNNKEIPFLIDAAVSLARSYHFTQVEPEHLLFVIVSQSDLSGHRLLIAKKLSPNKLRERLGEWLYGMSLIRTVEGLQPDTTEETGRGREQRESILDRTTTDLTALAATGRLDKLVGREQELDALIRSLLRRKKSNPLLIGDPGVGKTALVHGLAQLIVADQVPPRLAQKRLLEISVAALVAGTVYRGQFEERVRQLLGEVQQAGDCLLFIDEIHTMTGAGSTEGALDLANILKPFLASGEITLIGATTYEEYSRRIVADSALTRRFQPLFLTEPNLKQTEQIVRRALPELTRHHQVKIPFSLVPLSVALAERYLPDRLFPDKALDIIDEAAAEAQKGVPQSVGIVWLKQQLKQVLEQKYALVNSGQLPKAVKLHQKEQSIIAALKKMEQQPTQQKQPTVSENQLLSVVSRLANVPIDYIAANLQPKTTGVNIGAALRRRLVGQRPAIANLVRACQRAQAGLTDEHRPLGAYLFVGPTGVGKTETARVLANELFGPKSLIKLDMSELAERHSISQLIGSPKGYVGYDDSGTLVEQVRKQPFSVILLDEIDKAHPDIFNLLLQILEDGELTDTKGRRAYFRHAIIVLTANIGGEAAAPLGFLPSEGRGRLNEEIADLFRPELIGRLTAVIQFQPFTAAQIRLLIKRRLRLTSQRLRRLGQPVSFAPEIVKWLENQYDPTKGARSVDELVREKIDSFLADRQGLTGRQLLSRQGKSLTIQALTPPATFDKVTDVKQ